MDQPVVQHPPIDLAHLVADPVCGMSVRLDVASQQGLTFVHDGIEYGFCGRGCRLEFEEDPATYLSPDHIPAM